MRLFVAVWPSPDAVRHLESALEPVRQLAPGLRWVPSRNWHLTLTFLAEVPDAAQRELTGRLARAATRHAPLRLRFGAAGRFGDRVFFTRVSGDVDPLRWLAASTTAAARRTGLEVEDRAYRPHLTVARTNRSTRGLDLRKLVGALGDYEGPEWTAADLHLVQSRPGPSARAAAESGDQAGSDRAQEYRTIVSWPLTGRP